MEPAAHAGRGFNRHISLLPHLVGKNARIWLSKRPLHAAYLLHIPFFLFRVVRNGGGISIPLAPCVFRFQHIFHLRSTHQLLTDTRCQDGKPYILSASGAPAIDDARSQGFTFVAYATFKSMEDMVYYDTECQAHVDIKKAFQGKLAGPPLMVCTEG